MPSSSRQVADRLARALDLAFRDVPMPAAGRSDLLQLAGAIRIDSRQIDRGAVFWALRGSRRDGHEFVCDACSRGAAAAVVERTALMPPAVCRAAEDDRDGPALSAVGPGGLRGRDVQRLVIELPAASRRPARATPGILVPNTLKALQTLAGWWRRQHGDARVIAITGSVGKTTTRAMLACVLERCGPCVQSPASYNNHLGVPLSLLRLRDHAFGVFEAGTSAPGEIATLARWIRPTAAIITPVGASHLQALGTVAAVREEKAALLAALPAGAPVAIPADQPFFLRRARELGLRVLAVGDAAESRWRPTGVRSTSWGVAFRLAGVRFRLPVAGRHWILAAVSATALAAEYGVSVARAAEALAEFEPQPGRGRIIAAGRWTWIDDSYNANPLSMRAALKTLAEWPGAAARVAVLGDMLDLGAAGPGEHERLGRWAATLPIDRFVCFGDQMRYFVRAVPANDRARAILAETREELRERLAEVLAAVPGGVVLVKGSRAMRMESVLPADATDVAGSQT